MKKNSSKLDDTDYGILSILMQDAKTPYTEISNRLDISTGTVHARLKKMGKELKRIPEVVSAHYTTGVYSIFAKVVCRDTEHLRSVLSNSIQSVQGIQRTETFISLHESINRPLVLSEIESEK